MADATHGDPAPWSVALDAAGRMFEYTSGFQAEGLLPRTWQGEYWLTGGNIVNVEQLEAIVITMGIE